jgi:hypothetical protein
MKVFIIGDTHFPFCLPGYLEFCARVRDRFKPDRILHIGDEVDMHATSFHEKNPDCASAGDELAAAKKDLHRWEKEFGTVDVLEGNHSKLAKRQAAAAGISSDWIRSYPEVYGTKKWTWHYELEIDGVLYRHKPGVSGAGAMRKAAIKHRQSIAFGHLHGIAGVEFHANSRDLIFGIGVGCGVDRHARAMAYGEDFEDKPILGCGTIVDGVLPVFHPMNLGTKYPRNRR